VSYTTWEDLLLNRSRDFYQMIEDENVRQLKKWGVQDRTPFEWMAYLTEEVGELSKAICEMIYRKGSHRDIVDEAIQVATLAIKIAEMADHARTIQD